MPAERIKPFHIGAWKIFACDEDGFDVTHADESYHCTTLEEAVRLAQGSPRDTLPDRPDSYAGQVKDRGEGKSWRTLGTAPSGRYAGWLLAGAMQRRGFHYGEIGGERGHIADMVAGEILTAEDGTEFRVVNLHLDAGE
jgi:hypothetical protein